MTKFDSSQNPIFTQKIVFFDGHCALCNGFVDFLLAKSKRNEIYFAPLQGSTAQTLLEAEDIENLETVAFYSNQMILRKSEAVIAIMAILGGKWKVLACLVRLIPLALRDAIYTWVSKNRFRFFSKRTTCRLPTPGEAHKFLD